MNKITLLYKNSILDYYLTNNSFIPCHVGPNPEFIIRNITENGYYEIESENNSIYIFYNEFDNYYWVVDRTFQTTSMIKNGFIAGDIYETKICLLDGNNKSLCYRIPRNASTTIFSTYLNSFDFKFKMRPGKNIFVSNDLECIKNYIHIDDINTINHKDLIKYFVYRDPIDRFFSQASVLFYHAWIKIHKSFKIPQLFIHKNPKSTINFLMKCIEINNFYDLTDEYHINTQSKHIKNLGLTTDMVDVVVNNNDVKQFLSQHLNLNLVLRETTNKKLPINKNNIEISKLKTIRNILNDDFNLIEKFKDKLYK